MTDRLYSRDLISYGDPSAHIRWLDRELFAIQLMLNFGNNATNQRILHSNLVTNPRHKLFLDEEISRKHVFWNI